MEQEVFEEFLKLKLSSREEEVRNFLSSPTTKLVKRGSQSTVFTGSDKPYVVKVLHQSKDGSQSFLYDFARRCFEIALMKGGDMVPPSSVLENVLISNGIFGWRFDRAYASQRLQELEPFILSNVRQGNHRNLERLGESFAHAAHHIFAKGLFINSTYHRDFGINPAMWELECDSPNYRPIQLLDFGNLRDGLSGIVQGENGIAYEPSLTTTHQLRQRGFDLYLTRVNFTKFHPLLGEAYSQATGLIFDKGVEIPSQMTPMHIQTMVHDLVSKGKKIEIEKLLSMRAAIPKFEQYFIQNLLVMRYQDEFESIALKELQLYFNPNAQSTPATPLFK